MGTIFAVQLGNGSTDDASHQLRERATDALHVVRRVEQCCSRFDPTSELSQLSSRVHEAVAVSPLLFELVSLALAIAEASDGAFDPTVGRAMAAQGMRREWRSQREHLLPAPAGGSWRDIALDRTQGTITLHAPVHLDLGALAKGFAVDLIAEALAEVPHCSIHAGGDVRCCGAHPDGRDWRVGVRDPQHDSALLAWAELSQGAVCTSGNYEPRLVSSDSAAELRAVSHLLDPRTGRAAEGFASVSVAAPTAVIADGLATAAFVLGPERAPAWLESHSVDALLIDATGHITSTAPAGLARWTVPSSLSHDYTA
jgi:thiamine biosynthesis lipoprotein